MVELRSGAPLGASYRLLERIGAGAVGDVWRVESTSDGAVLAAKVLKSEHAADVSLVERFVRERSILMGLRHPGIVAVRDLVVEGATLAIVMDLVAGGSLRDLLVGSGPVRPADALIVCAHVLDALAEAHSHGITHRDIKPDNVLLSKTWRSGHESTVRVTDFGIASIVAERHGATTGLLGTPQYMAPELISHGATAPAVDVYSTGIMLYELMSGRAPFAGAGAGTGFTIAYRHVTALPPRLALPDQVWSALSRLLAKDPRERPSAAEAAAILRGLAREHAGLAPLTPLEPTDDFDEVERPATVLRGAGAIPAASVEIDDSTLAAESPELGDADQRTLLRPVAVHRSPVAREPDVAASATSSLRRKRVRFSRKAVVAAAAGAALLTGLVLGVGWWLSSESPEEPETAPGALETSQRDPALPTGLSIARTAHYDPETEEVTLEITYGAERAPLSGALLEVVPGLSAEDECPPVAWDGATATRNSAMTTGVSIECGWRIEGVEIPAKGEAVVTASFSLAPADEAALAQWLDTARAATADAVTSPDVSSTAYPAQRLMDVAVVVPPRTVSETTLPVTLIPVWPDGPDELTPLYRSPAVGAPSRLLRDIAGGEDGVRFSDACAGAVVVSSDGLVVTTLSVASGCTLSAQVGNFTDLRSTPFSVTTRE